MIAQFWINNTRDVSKFCQIGLAQAAHSILARFPNITSTINPKLYQQHRMITYSNDRFNWLFYDCKPLSVQKIQSVNLQIKSLLLGSLNHPSTSRTRKKIRFQTLNPVFPNPTDFPGSPLRP